MSGIIYQVTGALTLGFNCFIYGLSVTVPATSMILFMSQDTPLNRPMTQMEASLLVSSSFIGGVFGITLTGFLMDYLGRKKSSVLLAIVPVLTWSLLVFSNRVEVVIIAIFILGLAGSVFLIVPVYVSELAQDSIRGTLSSGTAIFSGTGVLTMFLLGEFLEYKMITHIGVTASTVGLLMLSILKESPTLLMKKGLESEAAIAMAFYRNSKPDSRVVMQEIDNIRRALAPEPQAMKPEDDKLAAELEISSAEKLSTWQFFKSSKSTRRAFLLNMVIMSAAIFQGMLAIQMYSIRLFSTAVPREVLSPNWCSALLCAVSVLTGLIAGYLIDVAGRRTLLIYSCISAGFCSLVLGTQLHLHWAPNWVTALFIYIFSVTFNCGSGIVPYVLLGEMFLPKVRSVLSMICLQLNFVVTFITLFSFNPLVSVIGLGPVFYLFSVVGFSTAVFAFFFLPETKGLTVDVIQVLLVKKKT